MTELEIIEVFIQSAEVDARLPQTAKPAVLKAMALPYVHDKADQNGWGAERYADERADFFNAKSTRLTKNQVRIWELSMEMIKLAGTDRQRRSLWAWARSKAGGQPFAKWCRTVENIAPHTGDMRKNRAIARIHACFVRDDAANTQNVENVGWTNDPEIRDKKSNIEFWRADDAKPICSFDEDLQDFSWSNRQNELRRQREARKRQREAA